MLNIYLISKLKLFTGYKNKMHKSIFTENQELSTIQAYDNYLTKNEKSKFYDQCKNTIRQKICVVNQGMLVF